MRSGVYSIIVFGIGDDWIVETVLCDFGWDVFV